MNHTSTLEQILPTQAATEEKPRAVLKLSVLGGVHFSYGDRDLDLRNRKARAVFAYIALTPNGEEQREKLAGLFWSEFSEQNARATLRQAIHEFREALLKAGCLALVSTRTSIGLRPGSFAVDLDDVLAAVADGQAHEALLGQDFLADTLLAGCDDLDPAFQEWLQARRQALRDQLIRGLETGYRDPSAARDQRWKLAEAAVRLDPTHEEACRVVMRCAAEAGQTGAAIRAYDELYRLLDRDFDMEPSLATQELIAEVKQGKFDKRAPGDLSPGPNPAHATPSYATEIRQALIPARRSGQGGQVIPVTPKPVLFVDNFAMSGIDADRVHLVEGFRAELIAGLIAFREWYVTGTAADLTEESRVSSRYAVVTTAYQAGATINVVMVLQERPSELAVWGERFELRLDRWHDAQQRIVRRIAATLNVELSAERLIRQSHIPDISLEAHDLWLRGRSIVCRYNPADWNRAVKMFARGIQKAPAFSPFYSSLAQSNNAMYLLQPGSFRKHDAVERTVMLAQRAVALDPDDSRAQLALGWAYALSGRYRAAEHHMSLACTLNGNDPWMLVSSAMLHAFNGNPQRARDQSARAMEITLSPAPSHWVYEACIRFLCGDDLGALEAAGRAPPLLTLPAWRVAALSRLGKTTEAADALRVFCAEARRNWINDDLPTDRMIAEWVLQAHPIGHEPTWTLFRDALAAAGMPVQGIAYTDAPVDSQPVIA